MTGIQQAVAAAGSQRALAAKCGVQEAAVSKWVARGYAPGKHVITLHHAYNVAIRDLVSPAVREMMALEGK